MDRLKFGTSGLRGLVTDLVGWPSFAWTLAFLRHLEATGAAGTRDLLVGRDLRASSPEIAAACVAAARVAGFRPLDAGALPTPALAREAIERGAAAVMVTGSHIPDDRNGLKFYRPDGEITKRDEDGILAAHERIERDTAAGGAEGASWDGAGAGGSVTARAIPARTDAPAQAVEATGAYASRYRAVFAPDALRGARIGVYQHSTVGRDLLVDLLANLGAAVTPLARSERFVPVDTEAHREEDKTLIAAWTKDGAFDAIVSADGDADRPLVADEAGAILRGDVIGMLAARFAGARTLVTPVTSSSAIETAGIARTVRRTRVGSPFVIAAMEEAVAAGESAVVGFEANGGFLVATPLAIGGALLAPLPTRDAVLPILAVLAAARSAGVPLSRLVHALDAGHAATHRLPQVVAERSGPFLEQLAADRPFADRFFAEQARIAALDTTDGVRVLLADGRSVHYRASGNAPELRCYVEAPTQPAAADLLQWGLNAAQRAL